MTEQRCLAEVHPPGRYGSFMGYPCGKPAKAPRHVDGFGTPFPVCGIHSRARFVRKWEPKR